jgi:hypothetical protein
MMNIIPFIYEYLYKLLFGNRGEKEEETFHRIE